jgi:hypothetical protein
MSATINDKLTQVKPNTTTNAPVTTVSTTRAIGGASLACVDLTDWPTDTAIHFQTYKKKADGTKDFTTAVDMKGIVSSNTIGSVTITNGTDAGNAIGDYVELNPTAAYGEGVYEWGTTEHNVDGTHANITTDSIKEQTASGLVLKDSSGNEYLKGSKTASAVNEFTVTNAATGNGPTLSATGGDTNIDMNFTPKGTGLLKLPAGKTAGLVRQRQGGTSGDGAWNTSGTTNTDTSAKAVFIQCGTQACTGSNVTITFPTAFSQIPVGFATPITANTQNSFARISSISTTQMTVELFTNSTTAVTAENFSWLAIGQ